MTEADDEPTIVLITMDIEASTVVFTRSDGMEARCPIDLQAEIRNDVIARLHWAPGGDVLLAQTKAGEEVLVELSRSDGQDQLAGRLVVYLDQNQWSTVAKALHGKPSATAAQREASRQLAEWVRQQRVVLPVSAGHYYETTKWGDAQRRYRLGLTVLCLSRGWQMRDPLQVRRDELHDLFRHRYFNGSGCRSTPVFTLAANALFGARRSTSRRTSTDLSPQAAFFAEALTSASVSVSVLLDPDRVEPGPRSGWATANQRFSDWLDGEPRDTQQKRKSIDVFVLADLRDEIAREAYASGLTPKQISSWIRGEGARGLAALPSTGLFREVTHYRHLNKGTVWRENDLTDMVYLSCAGAYADVVVCERHMAGPLAQGIRRLGSGAAVFRRLSDAVAALDERLGPAAGGGGHDGMGPTGAGASE